MNSLGKSIPLVICFGIMFFYAGGALVNGKELQGNNKATYFASPEEAIAIIETLLLEKEYRKLANYYDLSSSEIELSKLESGDFFIRKKRPEISHPADFWRYKHPFSPGFKYSGKSSGKKENVFLIEMDIEINQGPEFPAQDGIDQFYMIKSSKGWQILPDPVKEEEKEKEELEGLLKEITPTPPPPWEIEGD